MQRYAIALLIYIYAETVEGQKSKPIEKYLGRYKVYFWKKWFTDPQILFIISF